MAGISILNEGAGTAKVVGVRRKPGDEETLGRHRP